MCWRFHSITCSVLYLLLLLPSISSRPPAHRPPLKSPALRLCPLHLPPPRQSAILIFSEDLNELYALSDRLLVISHGAVSRPVDPQTTDAYAVAGMMTTHSDYAHSPEARV